MWPVGLGNSRILTGYARILPEHCSLLVFKIEALTWVSIWRALKFQLFSWRVGSNLRCQSKNNRNEIQDSYETCAWIIWYMFPIECEELRINHLTLLFVMTMPYACWFLWQVEYIEDFKWCLHFQFGVAFWRVVLWEVYFEGPNRVWRALKTSILSTKPSHPPSLLQFLSLSMHTLNGACPSCIWKKYHNPWNKVIQLERVAWNCVQFFF